MESCFVSSASAPMTARSALPAFIARLKAAALPHRVLWTVVEGALIRAQ
jgi:hypothetical protein